MAKTKEALKAKKEGHTVYTFLHDYPLGGKKKGDQISLPRVPSHLKEYFEETATAPRPNAPKLIGQLPDVEKATKEEILTFLHDNGVSKKETAGLTKEDLYTLLGQFYS